MVLALLGLTFSHESDGAQKTSPGTVNASNLNAYYMAGLPGETPLFHQQNYLSHLYGDMSQILGEKVDGGPIPIELDDSMVDLIYINTTNTWKYYVSPLDPYPAGIHISLLTRPAVQRIQLPETRKDPHGENKSLRDCLI